MATKRINTGTWDIDTGQPIFEEMVDNGDGTYARSVAASFALSTGQRGAAQLNPQGQLATVALGLATAWTTYRSALTAPDLLATPTTCTFTGQSLGGSLASGTTYYAAYAAANIFGPTKVSSIATGSPGGSNNALRLAVAQITGSTYYDLFLSTDTAPKWVARITEAQRAAGGYQVTAVGTVTHTGSCPAGSIDILVVGTGQQTSATNFGTNQAFVVPPADGATALACSGYNTLLVQPQVTLTDLRVAPSFTLQVMRQRTDGQWFVGGNSAFALLGAVGGGLLPLVSLGSTFGAPAVHILLSAIAGQGASIDLWTCLV